MRTRIAIVSLLATLGALAPAAAGAQANEPGAPGAPYPPPYGGVPPVGQHVRDNWYIGFGFGSGFGNLTTNGQTLSFHDVLSQNGVDSNITLALQFEVGATLRPDLLLGLDIRALRSQGSSALTGSDLGVQATDLLAMLTWFPARDGFFLRAGAGFAGLTLDSRAGGAFASEDHSGIGVLGGIGYAFWLGRRFNLTLNLDASAQYYGGGADVVTSSRFVDAYLGFAWY